MIELEDIHKNLGGVDVLRGISFRIERGETLAVVGPSGTGKSVTLQHVMGLMRPDSGRVCIDGEDVQSASSNRLRHLRDHIGVLFQSGALINWMSVFDNVALPLYEKTRLSDEEIRVRVEEKLALVGLSDAGSKMPAEISGGMRKRAGLARAIVRDPQIVLYDEPTSGLDPIMSRSIDQLLLRLKKELKTTSIMVTHDLVSAFAVADRVALLHQGVVAVNLSPREFAASQHPFVRRFVESQLGRDVLQEIR